MPGLPYCEMFPLYDVNTIKIASEKIEKGRILILTASREAMYERPICAVSTYSRARSLHVIFHPFFAQNGLLTEVDIEKTL
jgi:hypothetical protein